MDEKTPLPFDWRTFLSQYYSLQPQNLERALSVIDLPLVGPPCLSQFLPEDIFKIEKLIEAFVREQRLGSNHLISLLRRLQVFIVERYPEILEEPNLLSDLKAQIIEARLHNLSLADLKWQVFDYLEGRVATDILSSGVSVSAKIEELCEKLQIEVDNDFKVFGQKVLTFYLEYQDMCKKEVDL